MPDVIRLCDSLFTRGHDVSAEGDLVRGNGMTPDGPVAVIGTRNHAAIGVDLAFALAGEVLQVVERFPERPILMLVDTQGIEPEEFLLAAKSATRSLHPIFTGGLAGRRASGARSV